jgi:ubiquinone/menaquinone biosynthesis C-methylase UbiE
MLEKMTEFFDNRIDLYEDHMLSLSHIKNGYVKLAELMPNDSKNLLDLGCGTGLELVEIYKKFPEIKVTGIDLTQKMLNKLKEKFYAKNIKLINENYFKYDFGGNLYDIIISCETLHHFEHEEKIKLYKKIYNALIQKGQYIECDYMVFKQEEEDFYFSENRKLRIENRIKDDEFFHYDTPCTIENQIKMMNKAGFKNVTEEWREENTVIIRARK